MLIERNTMLIEKLNQSLREAMTTKDDLTKMVIRNIKAQVEKKQQEKVLRDKPEDAAEAKRAVPSDEMVVEAIRKEAKELTKAIRELPVECKLVAEYKDQLGVCTKLLPEIETDTEAIKRAVEASISELGSETYKTSSIHVGAVIGHVMRNNKGFPGSMVKRLVHQMIGE